MKKTETLRCKREEKDRLKASAIMHSFCCFDDDPNLILNYFKLLTAVDLTTGNGAESLTKLLTCLFVFEV
jgi:hypothetical protein